MNTVTNIADLLIKRIHFKQSLYLFQMIMRTLPISDGITSDNLIYILNNEFIKVFIFDIEKEFFFGGGNNKR